MNEKKILVIATNLFFLPRVQNVASAHGCDTRQVMTLDRLREEMADGSPVVLALVDLEGDPGFWEEAVRTMQDARPSPPKIVGYGGHTNTAMLHKAQEVGCDLVLTKGQFSRDLAKLIADATAAIPCPTPPPML